MDGRVEVRVGLTARVSHHLQAVSTPSTGSAALTRRLPALDPSCEEARVRAVGAGLPAVVWCASHPAGRTSVILSSAASHIGHARSNTQQLWRPRNVEESEAALVLVGTANDALFDCLRKLHSLTFLELTGSVGVCADMRLSHAVLSSLFADRLLHAALPAQVISLWLRDVGEQAAAQRDEQRYLRSLQQQTDTASDGSFDYDAAAASYATAQHSSHPQWHECHSLQSLHVQASDMLAMHDLLRAFPSLLVLSLPVGRSYTEREPSACSTALRFLSTSAHIGGLPELAYLSS